MLGVGGGTAAVLALGIERRRAIALVVGGGLLAVAGLLAIDLVLGGAHLSRSVLGAGEAGDVADVFTRRLRLMTNTFIHPVYPELLAVTVLLLVAGVVKRRTVLSWFGDPRGGASCGFLGALAGVLVGTVANDSGSVLLVLGTIYLASRPGSSGRAGRRAERAPSARSPGRRKLSGRLMSRIGTISTAARSAKLRSARMPRVRDESRTDPTLVAAKR